jgi:hypothetical protein
MLNLNPTIRVASRLVAIAACIGSMSAASEAKDFCSVAKSQWQPQSSLVRKLEGQGWKIRNMKIDSGCYEVYGTDGTGKSRETHFNPATLQPVAERHQG